MQQNISEGEHGLVATNLTIKYHHGVSLCIIITHVLYQLNFQCLSYNEPANVFSNIEAFLWIFFRVVT